MLNSSHFNTAISNQNYYWGSQTANPPSNKALPPLVSTGFLFPTSITNYSSVC